MKKTADGAASAVRSIRSLVAQRRPPMRGHNGGYRAISIRAMSFIPIA
jgi:hypothetical protein